MPLWRWTAKHKIGWKHLGGSQWRDGQGHHWTMFDAPKDWKPEEWVGDSMRFPPHNAEPIRAGVDSEST